MQVVITAPDQVGAGEELEVEVSLESNAQERPQAIQVELVRGVAGDAEGQRPVARLDETLERAATLTPEALALQQRLRLMRQRHDLLRAGAGPYR